MSIQQTSPPCQADRWLARLSETLGQLGGDAGANIAALRALAAEARAERPGVAESHVLTLIEAAVAAQEAQRRTADALRESEARRTALVETALDCVITINGQGVVVEWNRAAEQTFGYSRAEALGRDLTALIVPPAQAHAHSAGLAHYLATGVGPVLNRRIEVPAVRKDGARLRVELTVSPLQVGDQHLFIAYLRDITESARAEEALRQAEEKYRGLFENAVEGLWQTTPEGRYLSVNPAMARLYGYDSAQDMIESVTDLGREVYVDSQDRVRYKALIARHGSVTDFEARVWRRDGMMIWISESSRGVYGDDGALLHYEGSVEDVTARKWAEQELRERTEILATVLDTVPHFVFWKDLDSVYLGCNQNFARAAGLHSPADIAGKTDHDLPWTPEEADSYRAHDRAVIVSGQATTDVEETWRRADGTEVALLTSKIPLRDGAGRIFGVLGVYQDVTARRQQEETLRLMSSAVECASDAIVTQDLRSGALYCNKAFVDMFGCEAAELDARGGLVSLFTDRAQGLATLSRARQGDAWAGETQMRTRSGDLLDIFLRASPVRDETGAIIGRSAILADVTHQKKTEAALRQAEERYRTLFENAQMGIYQATPDGRLVTANPALARILGYDSLEELTERFENRRANYVLPERRQEFLRKIHENGVVTDFEFEDHRNGGGTVWLSENARAVYDEAGSVLYYEGMITDITDRKRAEEALREQSEFLRHVFDLEPNMLFVKDWDGNFVLVNQAMADVYGLTPDVVMGQSHADLNGDAAEAAHFLADDREVIALRREKLIPEEKITDRWGNTRWLQTVKRPLVSPDGTCRQLLGIATDITWRRQAAEELQRSRDRFALAVAGSKDGLWDWDLDTDAVYLSPRWKAILGYADAELENSLKSWLDLMHPEDAARIQQTLEAYFAGQISDYEPEFRMRHKDGSWRWILARGVAVRDAQGRPCRMAGSHTDVTARKWAEQELRERTEILGTVLGTVPYFVFWKDLDSVYLGCNENFARAAGLARPADVVGKTDHDLPWTRAEADSYREHDRRVMDSGEAVVNLEETQLQADGSTMTILTSKIPLRDGAGRTFGVLGIFNDISERKQEEEALRASREMLQTVIDSSPLVICVLDADGTVRQWNPAAERTLGWTAAEARGRHWSALGTHTPAAAGASIRRVMQGETITGAEDRIRTKGGDLIDVSLSAAPLCDAQGRITQTMALMQDITDRKRAEAALRHSEHQLRESQEQLHMALRAADLGTWSRDLVTGQSSCSENYQRLVGSRRGEEFPSFAALLERIHPDDRAQVVAKTELARRDGTRYDCDYRIVAPDGAVRWLTAKGGFIYDAQSGQPTRITGVVMDITARKQAEATLQRSLSVLRAQQEAAPDGILIVDENRRIAGYNQRLCQIWNTPEEIMRSGDDDRHLAYVLSLMKHPEEFQERVNYLYGHPTESSHEEIVLKDGRIVDRYSAPIVSEQGDPLGRVWYFRDVTAQRALEAERERMLAEAQERADRDPLTGLVNHRAFHKRLEEEADRAQRAGTSLAVAMIDLDNFKFFNDAYGHAAGDDVLRRVAATLAAQCRSYDTLARFGGDEFALLMPGLPMGEAALLAARLRDSLTGLGFRPPGYDVAIPIGLSAGVAVFPDEAASRTDAVALADARLRRTKTGGGDSDDLIERLHTHLTSTLGGFSMLSALVTAVDNKDRYTRRHSEDVLHYSRQIAIEMGMDEETLLTVQTAALLHDVGKIGVPDAILRKPGRLSEEDFQAIQQHPMMGAIIVGAVPGFEATLDAIRHHHERWDGQGYPFGLKGEECPLMARLMAVADAFSAMTTDRPYRKGMPEQKALAILEAGAGTQWDPACVAAFVRARRPSNQETVG